MRRLLLLALVTALCGLFVGPAGADRAGATCSLAPNPATLGDTVVFNVSDLTGKNYLRIANTLNDEMTIVELENAKGYSFTFTPPNAGSFLFEVYRDDESGNYFNTTAYYKCRVTLEVLP